MNLREISMSYRWKEALQDKKFRQVFVVSVLLLAFVLFFLTQFLNYVEAREGISFTDPLHVYFEAIDLTWIIFSIIYLSLIAALISLLPYPGQLLFAIQLYTLMVIVRIGAMYLLPLNPPEGMIILYDPFVEFFGTGQTLTKDLFFSGHTASILIFFLTAKLRLFRIIFLLLVLLIALLVIIQKVHYTIDVYAAVFFTLSSYLILKQIKERYNV
jgi:hypothetical protein